MRLFGRRRPAQAEAELHAELAAIGDETPLQLSIVLRDGDEISAAHEELVARLGAELSVEPGRVASSKPRQPFSRGRRPCCAC